MADLNGDYDSQSQSKKLKQTTSMAVNDDIILEIIARFSLKQAIQCSVLNKNLRRWVSQPQFQRRHCSRATTIFHCSASYSEARKLTTLPTEFTSSVTVTLERETSILASCDGLLLLRIFNHYHVFNPITAAIMSLDSRDYSSFNNVGLAVHVADSPFILVAADLTIEPDRTAVLFTVVAPGPDGRSMCLKSRVEFITPRSFTLEADLNVRPVYAAGSLYWLGDNGGVTLAFDVEKQQARITDGPVANKNRSDQTGLKWFGPAHDGSIRLVHAMQEEIVIHGHDRATGVWRIDHRIGNISNASNNNYRFGQPVYFDGGRLVLLVRKIEENGEIHIYDVLSKKWKKRYIFSGWWMDIRQNFFSFIPTTAKVSNFYLKDLKEIEMEMEREMEKERERRRKWWEKRERMKIEIKIPFHDTLLGLHRLLSPTAN